MVKQLDVRPILQAGGEPFGEIMAFVQALEPGQAFELLATFRPDPLFKVMEGKGYANRSEELADGSWSVLFTPVD
ncbi:MAG: DUF2249 domain-containing protein [Thermaerobacter sp.]|nr:DUF2249 domain-containing protein [Thermaerobacter sp.]